jgi:integrase
MKWKSSAAKSRVGIAETMATLAPVLVEKAAKSPGALDLRAATYHWACRHPGRRACPPEEFKEAVDWLRLHSLTVSALAQPATLRRALDALGAKLDGGPVAASTFRRKRAVFHSALEYAVEQCLLTVNPLTKLKHAIPKTAEAVDPRVLIDRSRAEALLAALRAQGRMGHHLVAFFGCIYYAALRPSEAVALCGASVTLPEPGTSWGELHLTRSTPASGRAWTNNGQRRDSRQLKHRAIGDVRIVPCHPRLVELLRAHLDEFGTAPDGRLFRGARGGPLSEGVYSRAWAQARVAALTPAEAASSMAARSYDLRHACVTTWLNATGDPAQVAAWAGHSVNVLLRVYVRCVAGRDELAKQLIERAIGD